MTCIAAVTDGKTVWMGGDSAGTSNWDMTIRLDPKVFENGDFLFGFTTSFRMGQLLQYSLVPPAPHEGQDLFAFMATDFINAVRDCLKAGGYASKDKETESGGSFLVGFRGRLFKVDSNYQVGENRCGYDALGCGERFALGALSALRSHNNGGFTNQWPPHVQIELAIEAAENHSAGVRGPFTISSIRSPE